MLARQITWNVLVSNKVDYDKEIGLIQPYAPQYLFL